MELRSNLLLAGASLFLVVSIPSGLMGAPEVGRGDGVVIPMAPPERMAPQEMLPPGVSRPEKPVPCPHPFGLSLIAKNPQYRDSRDFGFTPYHWDDLGDTQANSTYGYTFDLSHFVSNPKICCALTSAKLTVIVRCHGDIPQTDSWGIIRNNQGVWSASLGWKSGCNGQTQTLTWTATSTDLDHINTDERLSFYVQDDTTVISATLTVLGCCCGQCHHHPGGTD